MPVTALSKPSDQSLTLLQQKLSPRIVVRDVGSEETFGMLFLKLPSLLTYPDDEASHAAAWPFSAIVLQHLLWIATMKSAVGCVSWLHVGVWVVDQTISFT